MDALLTTKAALLQALRLGPGYGRELIRRLRVCAPGVIDPRPGTVYPALEGLVHKGHVSRWIVVPGGHRGARARTYYELTRRGVAASEVQRQSLARLTQGRPAEPASDEEILMMRNRLRRGSALSAFGLDLRRKLLRTQRRRAS